MSHDAPRVRYVEGRTEHHANLRRTEEGEFLALLYFPNGNHGTQTKPDR